LDGLALRRITSAVTSGGEGPKAGNHNQQRPAVASHKESVAYDYKRHLIVSIIPDRGPAPNVPHFRAALDEGLSRKPITTLAADAGRDAEHIHEYARGRRSVAAPRRPRAGAGDD